MKKNIFVKRIKIVILLSILFAGSLFLINGKGKTHQIDLKKSFNNHNGNKNFQNTNIYGGEYFLTKKNKEHLKTLPIQTLKSESKFQGKDIFRMHPKKAIRTNQWFSSLYFKPGSEAIFSFPLAIKFNDAGFSISTPFPGGNESLVMGAFTPDIDVVFPRKVIANVLETGDFSVKVALVDDNKQTVGIVTITHGSPYVFIVLKNKEKVEVYSHDKSQKFIESDGQFILKKESANIKYGLFKSTGVDSKINMEEENDEYLEYIISNKKELKNNPFFSIGVSPEKMEWTTFKSAGLNPIENTSFEFLKNKKGEYINVFNIKTRQKEGTIWGLLPHQMAGLIKNENSIDQKCFSEDYFKTIRGKERLCYGQVFYIKNDLKLTPEKSLDVQTLQGEYRDKMISLVKDDISKINGFKATDTYFLGKELLRVAQLYDFAKQLNLDPESRKLQELLYSEFSTWSSNTKNGNQPEYGKYLTYDNVIGGVVGHKTSFGSEEFNDHHFHYGYFVHTAAILGRYDKNFINNYSDFINLLVKDYLNTDRNNNDFAFIRNFDIYEGHSWASGTANFGDGNNQESSSEAVHAYYAGYLWGDVLGDENLKEVSKWLYNQEFNSALTYWLLAKNYSPKYEKYQHSLISLLWGGKVEFGTWFSGESEAKVGIQLIPFTAGSEYLKYAGKDKIKEHLAETSFPQKKIFFDQLLMYKAMENPKEALKLFENIEDKDLDGGNSRSFLYAWIVTRLK